MGELELLDKEQLREDYRKNLEYVMDSVEKLGENLEGRTVVTADHGNAFGEFMIYGHPEGMLLPSIKNIPWVSTSAVDRGTFNSTGKHVGDGEEKTDIESHLDDLGYL